MKYLYIPLFLVISVSVSFWISSEIEHREENGIFFCKEAISISKPYGLHSLVTEPVVTKNSLDKITFDWEDLLVTGKNGNRSVSIARCVYSKIDEEIIFLSIYGDNLISDNNDIINSLSESSPEKARVIAKNMGLNNRQIAWLKRNGSKFLYGHYNHENKIRGTLEIHEIDLMEINDLNIINLYPNRKLKNQFLSVATNLSSALSRSL